LDAIAYTRIVIVGCPTPDTDRVEGAPEFFPLLTTGTSGAIGSEHIRALGAATPETTSHEPHFMAGAIEPTDGKTKCLRKEVWALFTPNSV
jgi:hypothetical protein